MKSLAPILLALQFFAPLSAPPPPCCVELEAVDPCCGSSEPQCPTTPSGECALDASAVQATATPSTGHAPELSFVLAWTVVPFTFTPARVDHPIAVRSRTRAAPDEIFSPPLRI